ncbi:MAG: hypothetical protein V8R91_16740 [Butyricimonas faecihominis]
MFKIINFGSEEIPKFHAVFTITVNGETKDVIPAFTDYSFKCKNFEKDKLSKSVDKTKILPTSSVSQNLESSLKRVSSYTIILVENWLIRKICKYQ